MRLDFGTARISGLGADTAPVTVLQPSTHTDPYLICAGGLLSQADSPVNCVNPVTGATYDPATGQMIPLTPEQQAAFLAANVATSGGTANVLDASSASAGSGLLSSTFFRASTIIPGVPDWTVYAGLGLLAFFTLKGGRR